MSAADRERVAMTAQVADFMRKKKLTLDDITNIGGEDLKSPDAKRVEKARRVEACWSMMARLGVKYADFEHAQSDCVRIPALAS